jgi:hypothetical protein
MCHHDWKLPVGYNQQAYNRHPHVQQLAAALAAGDEAASRVDRKCEMVTAATRGMPQCFRTGSA